MDIFSYTHKHIGEFDLWTSFQDPCEYDWNHPEIQT